MNIEQEGELQNSKFLSTLLMVVNIFLLLFFLNYGYVTEDQSIHYLFLAICFVFALNLTYVLYYKQNYKTLSFWVLMITSILFIISTLLYLYLIFYTYSI